MQLFIPLDFLGMGAQKIKSHLNFEKKQLHIGKISALPPWKWTFGE
jgi:hypothetical protein